MDIGFLKIVNGVNECGTVSIRERISIPNVYISPNVSNIELIHHQMAISIHHGSS